MKKDTVRREYAEHVLSTKPVENWRGLGDKENPSGLYLGNNKEKISAALAWKNRQDLPILKNGNSIGLKSINIDKKKYFIVEYMRI